MCKEVSATSFGRVLQINTVGVGVAIGQSCMILSAGTKGKRFMLPHATGDMSFCTSPVLSRSLVTLGSIGGSTYCSPLPSELACSRCMHSGIHLQLQICLGAVQDPPVAMLVGGASASNLLTQAVHDCSANLSLAASLLSVHVSCPHIGSRWHMGVMAHEDGMFFGMRFACTVLPWSIANLMW